MSKSKRKNTAAQYWHEVISAIRSKRDFWKERAANAKLLKRK